MTLYQYLAIFIATYMLVFPVLGFLVPTTQSSRRGKMWYSWIGIALGHWLERLGCAATAVLCVWLWHLPAPTTTVVTASFTEPSQAIVWHVDPPEDTDENP